MRDHAYIQLIKINRALEWQSTLQSFNEPNPQEFSIEKFSCIQCPVTVCRTPEAIGSLIENMNTRQRTVSEMSMGSLCLRLLATAGSPLDSQPTRVASIEKSQFMLETWGTIPA